jgi:hypothetical protein
LRRTLLVAVGFVLLIASPASAVTINLAASLDCAQANAGVGTCGAGGTGTGTANIVLDTDTNALSWSVAWSGLSASATAAHFHGSALPNQNAGVQLGIGVTSNPAVGNAVLSDEQETALLNGLWYVNVHSAAFPGGEIRGQVTVVPEPSTMLLVGIGLALAASARRAGAHR